MDPPREVFDRLYAPDRYYRLAAADIKRRIVREVQRARGEGDRGQGAAQDMWAALDLIDVIGIPNVGILVFFRLSQTGNRINVYVADVLSFADIDRARGAIDAGRPADEFLGEGYDVFDDDFIFSFPAFAAHVKAVISVSANEFFAIDKGRKGEGPRSAHPGPPGPAPGGPRAGGPAPEGPRG